MVKEGRKWGVRDILILRKLNLAMHHVLDISSLLKLVREHLRIDSTASIYWWEVGSVNADQLRTGLINGLNLLDGVLRQLIKTLSCFHYRQLACVC